MANSALWSAVAATLLIPPIALAEVAETDFAPRTTQDRSNLCSAPDDDPN